MPAPEDGLVILRSLDLRVIVWFPHLRAQICGPAISAWGDFPKCSLCPFPKRSRRPIQFVLCL